MAPIIFTFLFFFFLFHLLLLSFFLSFFLSFLSRCFLSRHWPSHSQNSSSPTAPTSALQSLSNQCRSYRYIKTDRDRAHYYEPIRQLPFSTANLMRYTHRSVRYASLSRPLHPSVGALSTASILAPATISAEFIHLFIFFPIFYLFILYIFFFCSLSLSLSFRLSNSNSFENSTSSSYSSSSSSSFQGFEKKPVRCSLFLFFFLSFLSCFLMHK